LLGAVCVIYPSLSHNIIPHYTTHSAKCGLFFL
jgi:hypothetical protein